MTRSKGINISAKVDHLIWFNSLFMGKLKDKFPQTELFRVEDKFGSWPEVMKTHFTSGGELDKLLAAGRK